jgi:hypothetical protein
MPTLDTTVVYQGLTIKFHSSHAPTELQKMKLYSSFALAKTILDKVIAEIQTIISELERIKKKQLLQMSMTSITRQILVHHFHLTLPKDKDDPALTTFSNDLKKILGFYRATRAGLNGPMTISDAYAGVLRKLARGVANPSADRGYVSARRDHTQPAKATGLFPRFDPDLAGGTKYSTARKGSVHINFDLLNTDSKLSVARTIIHESTHRFKDTEDHAYAWYHQTNVDPGDKAYNELDKDEAMDNADSYAYAAICIYKKKLLTGPINTLS